MHNRNDVCCGQSASHFVRLKMNSNIIVKRKKSIKMILSITRKKVNVSSSATVTKCNYLMVFELLFDLKEEEKKIPFFS